MLRLWDSGATNSLPPATYITGNMTKLTHNPLPPLELLQELFEISLDSPSGLVWRNPRAYNIKPGQIAGHKSKHDGYWKVGVKTDVLKAYPAHRIVYFLQTEKNPENLTVDHVFGKHDPLSLRLATVSENGGNRKQTKFYAGKKCSSKFKGVYWCKKSQKWKVNIQVKKKAMYLGLFIDEKEAAVAYNKAAIEHFGEFAKLNTFEEPA